MRRKFDEGGASDPEKQHDSVPRRIFSAVVTEQVLRLQMKVQSERCEQERRRLEDKLALAEREIRRLKLELSLIRNH